MSNACDAHALHCVVDNVNHAPVTDPDAPLIFAALQFFASGGSWRIAQCLQFSNDARQQFIRQRFKFLLRRRLYLNGILTHAADRVLRGPP